MGLALASASSCRMPLPDIALHAFRRITIAGAGLALCAGVAGCEALRAPAPVSPTTRPAIVRDTPPAPAPPPPVVVFVPKQDDGDRAVRQLLEYDARLAMMDISELRREIGRLGDGSSPAAAMDLALALGHTRSSGDVARAQGLLERVLRDGTAQAQQWHPLARLLWTRYAAQRSAEEQVERLGLQLRDNQRDNQRKLDQVNEKLEALRAIERSLISRQPPGSAPTPLPSPPQPPARPAP